MFLNYINGAFVGSADGTTLPVTNPATNETVGEVPRSKEDDVNAGVTGTCSSPALGSWLVTHVYCAIFRMMIEGGGAWSWADS